MPVNVTGLERGARRPASDFYVLDDIATARADRRQARRQEPQRRPGRRTGRTSRSKTCSIAWASEEAQTLNIILRADVRGSIEAIQKELTKLEHPEVQDQGAAGHGRRHHRGRRAPGRRLGRDHHRLQRRARRKGPHRWPSDRGVQIRRYDIIYKLTDDLKAALEGMLEPEKREVELGRALVQRTFTISRVGTIAGCRVLSGTVQRNARVRVIRDNRVIGDYALESLKREKDDAREVREGMECGIKLAGFQRREGRRRPGGLSHRRGRPHVLRLEGLMLTEARRNRRGELNRWNSSFSLRRTGSSGSTA